MFNIVRSCCCLKNRSSKCSNFSIQSENLICLNSSRIGQEIVLLKNCSRVCGSGGAVLNQALLQNKSYFEIKIQQTGHWSIGLCTLNTDLNKSRGGSDTHSWCLNAENFAMHNNQIVFDLNEMYGSNGVGIVNNDKDQLIPMQNVPTILPGSSSHRSFLPQEGDIVGVSFDHVEINFYLNGKNLNIPILVRHSHAESLQKQQHNNEMYPCLYVEDGAILDLIVDNFNYKIPNGYDKVMVEQTLL